MTSLFGKTRKRKHSQSRESVFHEEDNDPMSVKGTNPKVTKKEGALSPSSDSKQTLLKGVVDEKSKRSKSKSTRTNATEKAISTFQDIGLIPPLQQTCNSLGYHVPTPVQKRVIPFLLTDTSSHLLALSSTGSGKTASFVLPILHHLSYDPYGIYSIIMTPTRELAQQIYQQVLALGSNLNTKAALVMGGMDMTRQACELASKPHFAIATPGRLAALLRGPNPPNLRNVRYVVLDEADRLLNARSGFERDVAEILLHSTTTAVTDEDGTVVERRKRTNYQTLLFSATLSRSLESLEEMAGSGLGRLPLKKIVINGKKETRDKSKSSKGNEDKDNDDDNDSNEEDESSDESDNDDISSIPSIPAGLRQEYVFMPSHVRDAYLVTCVRYLMANGGRKGGDDVDRNDASGWNDTTMKGLESLNEQDEDDDSTSKKSSWKKAKSAIIFVSTCQRAALISGVLTQLGVSNVALHSLLTQNRRLASLAKFKSQHVRILVATDVASRGLDVPTVDLVLNAELPRRTVDYIHRVGRTARAGRRGRAVSLVGERDVGMVHSCEKMSGRELMKCDEVTDDLAVKLLGAVTKAIRVTKMKLDDIGFDELVKKMKERKIRDKKDRHRAERIAQRVLKKKS